MSERPSQQHDNESEARRVENRRPVRNENAVNGTDRSDANLRHYFEEDDRSRFFMSEPSVTTDGDRTVDSNNRSGLLSQLDSSDDESVDEVLFSSPPPPSVKHVASTSSPGNTSLSSRESPSFQNKVQMQFMQDKRSRLKIDSTPYAQALHATRQSSVRPGVSAKLDELESKKDHISAPSSRSTSSISMGQQQRAAEFFHDLKVQSVGALQDAGLSDYDSVPAAATDRREIDTVIRRHENRQEEAGDDTIVMTLSDSEGEKEDDFDSLEWEQQVSADDEQTFERPKRVRRAVASSGKNSPGHRRSRSGDSAAATLMNGGIDWKGMQEDRLCMPQSPDDGDDDDDSDDEQDDNEKAMHSIRKSSSGGAPLGIRNKSRSPWISKESTSDDSPVFKIGSLGTGKTGKSNRKTKKPPRQRTWRSERFDLQNGPLGGSHQPGTPPGPSLHRAQSLAGVGIRHPSQLYQSKNLSQGQFSRSMQQLARPNHEMLSSAGGFAANGFMNQNHNSFATNDNSNDSLHRLRLDPIGDFSQSLPQCVGGRDFGGRFNRQFSDSSGSLDAIQSTASVHSWIPRAGLPRPNPMRLSPDLGSLKEMQCPANGGRLKGEGYDEGSYSEDTVEGDGSSSQSSFEADEKDKKREIRVDQMRSSFRDGGRMFLPENLVDDNPYREMEQNAAGHSLSQRRSEARKVEFKSGTVSDRDPKQFPTFTCPKCGTLQRSFFTASTAPSQFEGPTSYLALYFAFYVVASLYIFGLEEGWKGLDCVYFAVITLTTAGLGDFVPTSDSAKIVCSIFIYFGVACIGLLLGTYLAGMLDESSYKEAMKSRADNCVECSRVKASLKRQLKRSVATPLNRRSVAFGKSNPLFSSERFTRATDAQEQVAQSVMEQTQKRTKRWHDGTGASDSEYANGAPSFSPHNGAGQQRQAFTPPSPIPEMKVFDAFAGELPSPIIPEPEFDSFNTVSPMTTQILGRQRHTRHQSFDIPNYGFYSNPTPSGKARDRNVDVNAPAMIQEPSCFHESFVNASPSLWNDGPHEEAHVFRDDDSTTSVDSVIEALGSSESRIKTAKYVFLTLKQALMNSIAIIFIGGVGFYVIESMTMVDSFYFTTVLLTTVGYGDIAPVTDGGKLFATVYVLVAGTVLLNNMSLISMIPLELRRRRIEKAVLTQFGDQLDDAALEELATGPLIHRLNLSAHNPSGLNECTREMFALAMLVRLGKVTERDVRHTFAAFRRLDVDREGVLNSKTIISGKIKKHRSMRDLREGLVESRSGSNSPQPPPSPEGGSSSNQGKFWFGHQGSLHVENPSSTFRFPVVRHASSMEESQGEHTALLDPGVSALPFAGGTFSSESNEELGLGGVIV